MKMSFIKVKLSAATTLDLMTQIEGERWGLECSGLIRWTGKLDLRCWQKHLSGSLERVLCQRQEPYHAHKKSQSDIEPELTCVIDTAPKSYFFNQNQFPTSTHRYEENEC